MCRERGGKLAEPETESEVETILSAPVIQYYKWWTGATTVFATSKDEKKYFWESDRVRPVTSLLELEWSNINKKYGWWCAQFLSYKQNPALLRAANCSYLFNLVRPICQDDNESETTTTEVDETTTETTSGHSDVDTTTPNATTTSSKGKLGVPKLPVL